MDSHLAPPRTTASAEPLAPSAVGGARPKVLIFTSDERKLASLSPFQRREGCDRFGKIARCEKLRDGGIEVEFVDDREAERALKATHFTYTDKDQQGRKEVNLSVSVSPHRTKNSSRGVIFCDDLEGMQNDEIAEGLSQFGVSAARRIYAKRSGALAPTHSIILTFNSLELPREVMIGYLSVKVRPYVPSPMRCFQCLRFGHTRDSCRNRPACGRCAATDHSSAECSSSELRCVNCDDSQTPHSSFDGRCPAFQREKEIMSLKVTERLSFRQARDRFAALHPKRS